MTRRIDTAHVRQLLDDALIHADWQPISADDVSSRLGVSDRTLRGWTRRATGGGVVHYLNTRQLQQAYDDLSASSPSRGMVTRIAMRYGFYELGRFSVQYRRYFGELPSTTLQRHAAADSVNCTASASRFRSFNSR